MVGTFGEQIVQFARALDSIDVRNFKRIRELIEKYTKRTLEITSTQLLVFEAGMLHGRSDIGSPVPASWIPVREAASPPTPFDFATQRMIVVPRGRDGRLDAKRFKDLFRSGLRGLLADDPSR